MKKTSKCSFIANEIFNKLKSVLNVGKDNELAEVLKVSPNKLATWKVRNHVPFEAIIRLGQEKCLDLNEIFGIKTAECSLGKQEELNKINELENENKQLKIKLSYLEELLLKKNIQTEEKRNIIRHNNIL